MMDEPHIPWPYRIPEFTAVDVGTQFVYCPAPACRFQLQGATVPTCPDCGTRLRIWRRSTKDEIFRALVDLSTLGWEVSSDGGSAWCRGTEIWLGLECGEWVMVAPHVSGAPEPLPPRQVYYSHGGAPWFDSSPVKLQLDQLDENLRVIGSRLAKFEANHFRVQQDQDHLIEAAPIASLPAFVEWWKLCMEYVDA